MSRKAVFCCFIFVLFFFSILIFLFLLERKKMAANLYVNCVYYFEQYIFSLFGLNSDQDSTAAQWNIIHKNTWITTYFSIMYFDS